jgi:Family of unknown function (DUF6459)
LTASPIPFEAGAFTAPVVDYEPPPLGVAELNVAGRAAPKLNVAGPAACPPSPYPSGGWGPSLQGECPQSSAALHGSPRRVLLPVDRVVAEPPPPRAAATFADAALRRVLEVIDRRRPMAQLKPMLTPPLLDMVFALTRTAGPDKAAVLRRVRLRTAAVDDQEPHEPLAAEVFATYTRGRRVRAIAGRIEFQRCDQRSGRWRLVALHIG